MVSTTSSSKRSGSQSLHDTVAAYTSDGAYTEFAEAEKGQLKAGMLADLVCLSENLEAADEATLRATRAVVTVCDGRVTHDGRL